MINRADYDEAMRLLRSSGQDVFSQVVTVVGNYYSAFCLLVLSERQRIKSTYNTIPESWVREKTRAEIKAILKRSSLRSTCDDVLFEDIQRGVIIYERHRLKAWDYMISHYPPQIFEWVFFHYDSCDRPIRLPETIVMDT